MNIDTVRDIEPAHVDVCPVTGLPIRRESEWTDVNFGKDYRVTLTILGDSILLSQVSGYATMPEMEHCLAFVGNVATQAISGDRAYVHIADYTNLQETSIEARKYFVEFIKKNWRILGLIFYGTSPMFNLSIKLAKRFNMVKFDVRIAKNYPNAVKLALDMLSTGTSQMDDAPLPLTPKPFSIPKKGGESCPITSLPITTKPEWTDIHIDDTFSVSYKLIGTAVLYAALNGTLSKTGVQKLFVEREKVLIEADLVDKKYAEIVDYRMHEGYPSKELRMMVIDFLLKESDAGNLLGFWAINPSSIIRWMYNVGIRMHPRPFPVRVAGDYRQAIGSAVNILEINGVDVGVRRYKKFTKDDWSLELDDYGIRLELIGDDLIYTVAHGSMKEVYVERFFDLNEKVFEEAGLTAKGYYYRIINWENLEKTTWKARKMYIDGVRALNRKIPCKFSVIFGQNKFMKTIIGFSKQFVPIPVTTAHNFEEAMAIIEREKKRKSGTKIVKDKKRAKETATDKKIRNYSDELLQFVGAINWDQEGTAWEDVSDSHPFKLVFDAMAIIKEDVDDLFRERKQSEERLRESEEKYRTILESIEDGYFEVDLAGTLTFFNDALCRITKFSRDELMGLNNREYMDEKTAKKVYETYARVYRTGEPVKGLEYPIRLKNDSLQKHVDTSVSLMKGPDGRPVGFRGVLRDVTERKEAEKRIRQYSENLEGMIKERTEDLRRSEEKYRTILESIEDGYYEVDLAGNLTFFNDAACRITEYSEDELRGLNNRQYTDKKTAQKLYREYRRVYETGIPVKRLDWEIIKRDGSKRFLETSISLIKDLENKPLGFRGILRDVTERKQLEHELIEKRRLAEEATEAKSEFLANMSHEIRTPLNGIIGMAELALDTELDDNQNNIFHTINTEANALLDVINEILDFSKIEAGKFDLDEIPFDLRVTFEDVVNSFAYRADQKGLDFISFLTPDVPSRLIGDPVRLRQILVNLMGNALKFTHEGELYLKGELVEEIEDRVKVRFSVKDTGIGIPEDRQATIFESFTQADGSTSRKYGGTGLGTTISKQLAEMMGGEIGLESEEGEGSTFWFTARFSRQEERKQIPAAKDLDFNTLKVLVVDDKQSNRFILMEYLKSWGCLRAEAADAKEALTLLKDAVSSEDPFNLILTDFQMPEMSGFDLAKEIKTIETLKGVPIVVLTSAGRKGHGRSCKEIGINGYLTKPIRQDELRKTIVSVLGLSTGEETPPPLPELVTRHTVAEDFRKEVQILLVEDYPTNQQVAKRHLMKGGYQVDLAEDGLQAVKAYKRKSYHLIFMDIQMPVMDGYTATQQIREIEARNLERSTIQRIPIIAMTAHAIRGYREKCLEAGMDDYIAKPLRRKEFLNMAEKWTKGMGGMDDCTTPRGNQKSKAPMEYERALEEFEGDKEFLMEVLEGFIENVRSQIRTILHAISDGDAEAVRREAHSIKGGAANLTANELSAIAFELEKIGKSGVLDRGTEILERLEAQFLRLETYARDG